MSYLLDAALPLVAFFLLVAFAKGLRAKTWVTAIQEGAIGALFSLVLSLIVDGFNTGCCEYVFDSDSGLGWNVPNTDSDRGRRGGALTSRRYSAERAHGNGGSLQVEVALMGGSEVVLTGEGDAAIPMNRGEVFVLLQQFPRSAGLSASRRTSGSHGSKRSWTCQQLWSANSRPSEPASFSSTSRRARRNPDVSTANPASRSMARDRFASAIDGGLCRRGKPVASESRLD